MTTPLFHRAVFWAVLFGIGLVLTLLIVPIVSRVTAGARRAVDATDLRQIVQGSVLYSVDHGDALPTATDVWDYARILADGADVAEPTLWLAMSDPAAPPAGTIPSRIVVSTTENPVPLHPDFRALKPSVAVALGKLNTRMPATTPVAWTRGLRPDGTWSPHSPYGTSGGYIAFLGGNVEFFPDLVSTHTKLARFDGKGSTSNILEALPAGASIGEYTPTAEEQTAWAEIIASRQKLGPLPSRAPLLFLIALWIPFLAISVCRLVKRSGGGLIVFIWPVLLSALLVAVSPSIR